MRIAFDAKRAYRNDSGLGNYSRSLISALAREYPVDEYLLFSPKKAKPSIAFPPKGIAVTEIGPTAGTDKLLPSVWRLKGMVKDLRKHKVDLYHGLSHELPMGIEKLGIPTVVTMHDLIFKRFPEFYKAADIRIYDRKYRHALDHADGIIAISRQTREDLISFYGIDPDRIQVIYQGIDPVYYKKRSDIEIQEYRQAKKIDGTFILTVGAGNARKNISTLFQSLKSFVPESRPRLLIAARQGSYLKRLEKEVKTQALEKWVRIVPDVPAEELPLLYQAASLLVFPSLFEGFGLPVGEALASGTPVVASKGTCFEEVGGPGALYVNPKNPQELAANIQAVLTKRELSERLVRQGQEFVQRFAIQDHASEVHALYARLLRK